MRVLGVVLYVAVLLCFFNIATAIDCGDNGAELKYASGSLAGSLSGFCVCDSGYNGTVCEHAPAGDCEGKEVAATIATDFPILDPNENSTTFRGNHLRTAILSVYVPGRRYTELNFVDTADTAVGRQCSVGTAGSFWNKIIANCSDRFELDLPWINHRSCGFKNDTTNTDQSVMKITGKLWIRYEDIVEEMEEFNITRKVSVPYKMTVTFQRFINVELLRLNITSDVHFGVALTGDEYDPETRILTLELTTIINYPNLFHVKYTDFFHPGHIQVIQGVLPTLTSYMIDVVPSVVASPDVNAPKCSIASGPCKQTWTMRLNISDLANATEACTFDGDYAIRYRLYTCRGTSSEVTELDCTFTYATVNWTLSTSDICGSIDIKPNVAGELLAFEKTMEYADMPNNKNMAKTAFKLGQYARFYADVQSDGNTITLHFNDVKFALKQDGIDAKDIPEGNFTYIWQNNAHNTDPTKHMANIHFEPDHANKGFQLYFHSSVFQVPPQETRHFVIVANCSIVFEGNAGETKKRTIEYTYEASAMDAVAKVGLSNGVTAPVVNQPAATTAKDNGAVTPVTFIASVVGAVAGTLIIVFVVVGFALRTRAQSEKRDAPASAAVSAASAAAATIEVAVNRA